MLLARVLIAMAMTLAVSTFASPPSAEVTPLADVGLHERHRSGSTPTTSIVPGSDVPATTVLDNPFIPENANIGDCVSALPRPECGSEARGGWHQAFVFIALIVGIALIGGRLALAVRRRDHARS